jgi:iron transport multicopper oxidase
LINYYLSPDNSDMTGGAEPVPDSLLMNDAQNVQFPITPGKTYLVHIINMGAIAGTYLQFDQHRVTVVEADGVWTMPYDVDQLYIAVAQRYTVLLTAKPTATQNFAIVAMMNPNMFGDIAQPASNTVSDNPLFPCFDALFVDRSRLPDGSCTTRQPLCRSLSRSNARSGTILT